MCVCVCVCLCVMRIPSVHNHIADALSHFQMQSYPNGKASSRSHPFSIIQCLLQCRHYGIATSICRSYQSGITAFQHFCTQYTCSPLPASSLTLQYFCASKSQYVPQKIFEGVFVVSVYGTLRKVSVIQPMIHFCN